jgi:actin
MPDKTIVKVPENFRVFCPELLFKPSLDGKSCETLQAALQNELEYDPDLTKELSKNIILSGGSTMFDGLTNRLKKEINNFAPVGANI